MFFFQAEDGIRDIGVTGVQTCALPICRIVLRDLYTFAGAADELIAADQSRARAVAVVSALPRRARAPRVRAVAVDATRSEERRVGKECRSGCSPYHLNKKPSTSYVVRC